MSRRVPLALVPGLCDDAELWRHQSTHLADLARPIDIDQSRDETMEALAERVLSACPGELAIAGMSMGGYVAFEVLRRAPERVLGVALVNTSARADTPAQTGLRRQQIARAQGGEFDEMVPEIMPRIVHPSRLGDKVLTSAIEAMIRRVGPAAYACQQRAIMSRADSRRLLEHIDCPALVIAGREDELTPLALSQEMASGIPTARLGLIEQCGHYSPMERPHAVTALMRQWLDEVLAGAGRRAAGKLSRGSS